MSSPPSGLSIDDFSESEVKSASSVSSDAERAPTPGADVDGTRKHPRFYDEDGSLTLLVDGTLFRVHGFVITSLSPFWTETLKSAPSEFVHEIKDASSDELVSFLSVIYPSIFDAPEVQTVTEWTAVLRFATMWQFKAVKRLAMKQLDERVSPLQRLVLARAYDLSSWLEQAFVALILMDELPDEAQMDGLDLNLKDFMRITRAREAIVKGRLSIDEHSVLLYVQKYILAVASTIPLEARSTSNETSVMPSPATHTHALAASTAGQTMALAGTLHMSPSEKAGSSLSSSHWQPALQSLPSDPPTAPLTPTALATTFVYVPYSTEEADRVRSKLLYYGSFDLAFNTIASASVPAFCETLHAQVFKEYGARFFQSLAARAARFPNFHPAGLYIASYAIRAFHRECDFETDVKATLAVLNGLNGRGAQLSNDNISTTFDKIPTTYKSGSRNVLLPVYSYLGLKEFLVYHPTICRQRVQNLKAFLTALVQAGLTDCDTSA